MKTSNVMMKTKARGAATPMTSELHSEHITLLRNISVGNATGQTTNDRITRGAQIVSKSNQITRVDDLTYTVRSQSSDKVYEILSTEHGWICSCPDHMYRGVICKHLCNPGPKERVATYLVDCQIL